MPPMESDTITATDSEHQPSPATDAQQGQSGETDAQGQPQADSAGSIDPNDVDYLELVEAQKVAKAAQEGHHQHQEGGKVDPSQFQPHADPVKPEDQGKDKAEGWIPKVRFDQAVSKEREQKEAERSRANYYQGAYDALASRHGVGGATGQQPAQSGDVAQPQQRMTTEQAVAELQAKKLAAAKQFDDGEITAAKLVEIQNQVDEEVWSVRQQALNATISQVAAQGQNNAAMAQDEAYVQAETDRLENEHPYTKLISSKSDWDYLGAKALESLAQKGIQIDLTRLSQRDRLVWRKEIAELTDRYGPTLTGVPKDQVFSNGGGNQGGANSGKPALTPNAQARAAKLEMQRSMPPNLTNMGHTAPEQVTDASITQMTDEEIMALPASVRESIMNKGAART